MKVLLSFLKAAKVISICMFFLHLPIMILEEHLPGFLKDILSCVRDPWSTVLLWIAPFAWLALYILIDHIWVKIKK